LRNAVFVRHITRDDWGPGIVIQEETGFQRVFFLRGGWRRITPAFLRVTEVTPSHSAVLEQVALVSSAAWHNPAHSVYVVELDEVVLKDSRFRDANPGRAAGGACVYVGMTGLTPEERFQRHVNGVQAARLVRRHGLRLRPDLYDGLSPIPHDVAKVMEPFLAESLRADGYAVWQR
jgi:hypothetical protein